ncbi:MAG: ester cyclase [Ktedonobacteraceae bacterium]|nr:ester cyclase [Ktedonobacteraceae bacterium]
MLIPTPQQVVCQIMTAFDQGDWTIFDSHPGLSETRQHLPHMRAAFPDLHHVIEVELSEGEFIACVMTVNATHQGPYMGIAPTGRQVRFMLLWIERIVDGKVIQHWALPDFLSLFQQIGATIGPTPATAPGAEQRP